MDALAGMGLVLTLMFALICCRRCLITVILGGIAATALLLGDVSLLPALFLGTLTDYGTLSLMAMLYLVFLLNNILNAAGAMKSGVESLEKMVGDNRLTLISVPMLIGLVPSPSGAVLSAPFVDILGDKSNISRERRLLINYWFRHVSEYINPIYPGVILATGLVGMAFRDFFLANLPVMAAYFVLGVVFFILPVKGVRFKRHIRAGGVIVFLRGVAPILAAVSIPMVVEVELHTALAVAVALGWVLHGKRVKSFSEVARKSVKVDLLVIVFLVMFFKFILEQSHTAEKILYALEALGVPEVAILVAVPMIMGALTGLTIGYVGLSFPILAPLFGAAGQVSMWAVMTAFVSGYIGILISPMHLCFSVTQKYFKADLKKTYRKLVTPLVATMLFTLLYAGLLQAL